MSARVLGQSIRILATAMAAGGLLAIITSQAATADAQAGVQQCTARCQNRQTTSTIRCDGDVACAERCERWRTTCVERCRTGKPKTAVDAGVDGPKRLEAGAGDAG